MNPDTMTQAVVPRDGEALRPPRRASRTVLTGTLGAVVGLAPHVLHHVAPLVGTALVAGAGGTALFGALGLALSVPMLLSLRRRFASWWAPAFALLAFLAMFAISAFLVGPLVSGEGLGVPGPVDPAEPHPGITSEHHA